MYPCDFYVLDEWRLGNIGETGLADMQNSETAKKIRSAVACRTGGVQDLSVVSVCAATAAP